MGDHVPTQLQECKNRYYNLLFTPMTSMGSGHSVVSQLIVYTAICYENIIVIYLLFFLYFTFGHIELFV